MRLLLVEDDLQLAKSLKTSLEQAGYAVDIADNGIEAEYMGNEGCYDLAILDLGLPKKSGLQVLEDWRSENNVLPVIILTARDAWHEKVDGFKAGADDYLGKPFHVEELIARANALAHRSRQKPGGTLAAAKLRLDEERQTVTLENGESVELTGTEFRLLRYMLLHPDRILSQSQLLEHVYDFDSEKNSNVIEVYIKRLRNKIGKEKIETRRGQGYLLRTH